MDPTVQYRISQDRAIRHAQNAEQLRPGTMTLPQSTRHSNVQRGGTHAGHAVLYSTGYRISDAQYNPNTSMTHNHRRSCMFESLNILDFS
jgi:hypothetical protein